MAGALLGFIGVAMGAVGAHALEGFLSIQSLKSFNTGVYYLQWHGSILLTLGLIFRKQTPLPPQVRYSILFFSMGILLFSGSIFGLVLLPLLNVKAQFLGPITPLGGLCLMLGWIFLFHFFVKQVKNKG